MNLRHVLREQGVATAIVEASLIGRVLGERDAGLPQEAEQRRALSADAPEHADGAVLLEEIERGTPSSPSGAIEPVLRERARRGRTAALRAPPARGFAHSLVDLVLEPDLPVAAAGVVLQAARNGGGVMRCQMRLERRQERAELLLLVEPEADPRSLLVLEALLELTDERFEDHPVTFATRSTPAFSKGSMLTFTPSSRSGVPALGPLARRLPGREDAVVALAAFRPLVVPLLDHWSLLVERLGLLDLGLPLQAVVGAAGLVGQARPRAGTPRSRRAGSWPRSFAIRFLSKRW